MKLFALPLTNNHKDLIEKYCFRKCGKVLVGGLNLDGLPCFPCKEEQCPHVDKEMNYGKSADGKAVYLRKLRNQNDQA